MKIGKLDRTKLRPESFKIVDEANSLTLIVRRNHWDNVEKYKEETTSPNQMVVMLPIYEYNRIQKHTSHLKDLAPKKRVGAISILVEGLLSRLPLKTV